MSKSPFPGMDPYLERHWRDVHHSLVIYARDQLQPRLPASLRALAEERVFVEAEGIPIQARNPDTFVVEYPHRGGGAAIVTEADILAPTEIEPLFIRVRSGPVVEIFLEIRDRESNNRVVTIIEFLSPTNKFSGAGRKEYLAKREECRQAGVNLVEVDLTRAGPRSAVLPVNLIPRSRRRATYLACIQRASRPTEVEVYPIPLRARLPQIPIPLRTDDAEVKLDLQVLVEQAYIGGSFDFEDYATDLRPPFAETEATWVDELLRKAGKRK